MRRIAPTATLKYLFLPIVMYKLLFSLFWRYNLPRWFILVIDTFICAFALGLALLFDLILIPSPADARNMPYDFAVVLGIRVLSFAISKHTKGVVRYTSSRDTGRISIVILAGSGLVFVLNLISLYVVLVLFHTQFHSYNRCTGFALLRLSRRA